MKIPIPVIIDTDFGGDPDDAVALVYALHSSEIKVLAIFTSDEYKNNHRALLIRRWLVSIGCEVPVFSGRDSGNKNLFLLDDFVQDDNGIGSIFGNNAAKAALVDLAHGRGQYIAIGGLSNISYLNDTFPEFFKSISIAIMGGTFKYHRENAFEHNVGLDIKSAQKIFRSSLEKRWILSEHTFAPELSVARAHKLYSFFAGKHDFFHSLVRINMDRFFETFYPDSRMHDPLAVSSVFLPTVMFLPRKILLTSACEFVPASDGLLAQVSNSVDYALFWSDMDKKLSY